MRLLPETGKRARMIGARRRCCQTRRSMRERRDKRRPARVGHPILLDSMVRPPPRDRPRPASAQSGPRPPMSELWRRCLSRLEAEFSAEDIHTYIAPLQAREDAAGVTLWAPNEYTMETVRERFLGRIALVLAHVAGGAREVQLQVGAARGARETARPVTRARNTGTGTRETAEPNLDPHYTFDNFVEGKSNQLGKAAATQVAMNPGRAYNPLLLYGGTGLGKTHLMHAAGNLMRANQPGVKILYLRSEQFVSGMVRALQQKGMDDFKRRFRSVDALLIDDIQFFAGKNTTQEEFFHTFN